MEVVMKVIAWITAHWEGLTGAILAIISMVTTIFTWVKNKRWDKLRQFVKSSMVAADKMTNFGPEEKLSFVLTQANQFAIEKGIKFDLEKVTALIEDGIEFSKSVNARPKDLKK